MFKTNDETESPNLRAWLRYMMKTESPNEGPCLRHDEPEMPNEGDKLETPMQGRVVDTQKKKYKKNKINSESNSRPSFMPDCGILGGSVDFGKTDVLKCIQGSPR